MLHLRSLFSGLLVCLLLTQRAQSADCLYQGFQGSPAEIQAFRNLVEEASARFDIPPLYLLAIKLTESSYTLDHTISRKNTNQTTDTSWMQVNYEVWSEELRRIGVTLKKDDFYNPRTNMMLSAWILRRHLDRFRDPYEAIGRYHSGTPRHKKNYQSLYAQNLRQLIQSCRASQIVAKNSQREVKTP